MYFVHITWSKEYTTIKTAIVKFAWSQWNSIKESPTPTPVLGPFPASL